MEERSPPQEPTLAEERMRSVVDHVVDGIITIDERGDIDSFNPAAEKLFGYERSEVIGRNVRMLMPEPYRSEHDRYLASYLATGQAKIIGIGREVVGRRKDGSTFPMELAVSEFRLGGRRNFTGIVRDVTERRRLEEQLRERVQELAAMDRQKNEFLAMLGHELRNPLAPMRNALYLMKMRGGSGAGDPLRDMLERQLQHLVRLVDDLLDVARIIGGKIALRREPVDLGEALARAVETAQPLIDAHGQAVELALPAEPLRVAGDLVRLTQVVANLLTNAAKYSAKSGRIRVSLAREGAEARLRVRDAGIGIAPELLPHVFDLFVQGRPSLARPQGGLGIGLTLVRRVVEMHGGRVAAASAGAGKGSEFSVWLPLLSQADKVRAPASAVRRRGAKRRVLVVDDNVDAAESIAAVLRLYGHEVRCVFEGRSALEEAERYAPDVVVLDIGLPGMDGYEVAQRLRKRPRFGRTPILAVTGYGSEADRQRAHRAGFDHHLTKPVDPDTLQRFIVQSRARRPAQ
jgi:PAS domain S-box-containing protein